MKKLLYILFSCALLLFECYSFAQQNKTSGDFERSGRTIDSLNQVFENTSQDTTKVILLNKLASKYEDIDESKAITYYNQAIALAEKIEYKNGLNISYHNMGLLYYAKSNFNKTLEYWKKRLIINEETGNTKLLAASYNNVGIIYKNQGLYAKALEYYFKALKINEETENKNWMANNYNNIGEIFNNQGNYSKALRYYFKALKIYENIEDKSIAIANTYNNIGIISNAQGNHVQALQYYFKSLKIIEKIGDKQGMAMCYNNIGIVYNEQDNYAKALEYYLKSLNKREEIGEKQGIAMCYNNIGSFYVEQAELEVDKNEQRVIYHNAFNYFLKAFKLTEEIGDKLEMTYSLKGMGQIRIQQGYMAEAIICLNKSVAAAEEIGAIKELKDAYNELRSVYEELNNYRKAYEYYKLYTQLKDSIFNEEKSKEIGKLEAGFDYDKKLVLEQAEHSKQLAVAASENKRQTVIIYAVSGGLLLLIVFFILLFNRFRIIRRQKNIIEKQKQVVEEKNKEITQKNKDITDSIRYAQNIQKAILPPIEEIKKALPESFILFKPKDIVSGDFYFFARVNQYTIIAAVDCTGHGVPGAFMSMIGNSLLNEIVNDKSVTKAAEVLDQLRDGIIHAFGEAGATGEQKDGMDMALCIFKSNKNNGIVNLQYAGAYNPVYIVRNDNNELTEILADKQPVGYHYGKQTPFTNHEIQLQKGDTIYIFSDGYQDQFGGPRGKKFMSKRFKQLFLDIQESDSTDSYRDRMSMEEQKEHLEKTLEDWKGHVEQVDDILVIGVRI